jgi:hypothetical protein
LNRYLTYRLLYELAADLAARIGKSLTASCGFCGPVLVGAICPIGFRHTRLATAASSSGSRMGGLNES